MAKINEPKRRQASDRTKSTERRLDVTERATREVFPADVRRNLTDSRRLAEHFDGQSDRSGDRYLVHLGR